MGNPELLERSSVPGRSGAAPASIALLLRLTQDYTLVHRLEQRWLARPATPVVSPRWLSASTSTA